MNLQSLRPAKEFALRFGVKAVIYGPPGSAKTPTVNSAPRPVLMACEPGLLSMRTSNVPTFQAYTVPAIEEFKTWLFSGSNELKQFDTIAIDSISQMAEIYLQDSLNKKTSAGNQAHGLKAYGEMATNTMSFLRALYYLPQKHTYLIAKEATVDDKIKYRKPFFPGQQLPVDIPHLFDEILQLGLQNVPGIGTVKAFRCHGSIDALARDRSGQLAEFEQPDFGQLILKAMR